MHGPLVLCSCMAWSHHMVSSRMGFAPGGGLHRGSGDGDGDDQIAINRETMKTR